MNAELLLRYGLPVAIFVFFIWMTGWFSVKSEKLAHEEYVKNEAHDAPVDYQVRWHIRHIREDMRLLIYTLMMTNFLLVIIAMVAVSKLL